MILLSKCELRFFLLTNAQAENGRIVFLLILAPEALFLSFSIRLIYNVFQGFKQSMGNAGGNGSQMEMFRVEREVGNMSVLRKKEGLDMYLMKTYSVGSKEDLVERLRFFKEYREKMEENQELTKLVEIIEEKDEYFCSTTHKLHVIYEYSDLHIGKEIKVRRESMRKINKKHHDHLKSKYFSYQDLCNILYSCLSALWFNKQLQNDNPDPQLKKYGTIFISSQNILIFGNGTLKIMDPFINDFNHRYNYNPSIYYSPEKLGNFGMTDDQKCAIFQLGMTLLEISLLESMADAYSGYEYREEVTNSKLKRAREVYASEVQNSLTVSVFDLIEKMLEKDRQERFNLQEAIDYAEQMYEVQQSFAQEISPPNPAKFLDQSNSNKKERRTNHSSSPRKSNSINKFQDFKNSTVFCRQNDSILRSPKVANFTIHEVEPQRQENSSMLESLKVDNVMRNEVNQSIMQGSVFSGINIADSYVYGNHCNTYKFGSTLKQEKIFTDPELMNTIYRELRQIQERKRYRNKDDNMFCSKVEERRDRYEFQPQSNTGAKITNKVYLA